MKKIISIAIIIVLSLVFNGCGNNQKLEQPTNKPLQNVKSNLKFTYNPKGKEEFIFYEKDIGLQKYGYDSFCPDTTNKYCYNRLPYNKYIGMKGYFNTLEPTKTDYDGNEFYLVTLENGEQYYFVAKFVKKLNTTKKYGTSSPIISLSQYKELQSFVSEPIVINSSIKTTGNKIGWVSYGERGRVFTLNNGKEISELKLNNLREIYNKFGKNKKIAELLIDMDIKRDDVDYEFFISPKSDFLLNEAKLYIGFNNKNLWLRFKVQYSDKNWIFVNSYKIAADNYRWQSPKYNFKRDNSSDRVWEWIDTSVSNKQLEAIKALSNAKKSIIRFQGNKYYSDFILNKKQKEILKKVLNLYNLMNKFQGQDT